VKRLIAASLLLLPAFYGCMKVRQELVVMPDGSGRLSFTFAIPAKGETSKFTEQELMSGDPDELMEKVRGVVALAKPSLEEKDGVVRIRMTAYFEDLNAVKFMDDGEGDKAKPKVTFSFKKEGEAFALAIQGNLLADDDPRRPDAAPLNDPELEKQREQLFKAMFAGFELRQDVKLPGPVATVDGFQSKEGRVAVYAVGEKDLQKPADQKKINQALHFKATCGKSEVSEDEAAAFRKELEAAKASWPALKAEMKKNAARK
jgi:hypothetical protein